MSDSVLLGVDIGGTKTSVSLGSTEGTVLAKKSFPTKGSVQSVVAGCYSIIEDLLENHSCYRPLSIGISCGGPLDSEKGLIQSPPNLPGWDNVPIVNYFSKRFKIPAYLENDANACALAEWYWGNGKGFDSIIFLTFGTGLGAGLILDGKLYRGTRGLSGEVGHWRMASEGPCCYHKQGSWESFCSGSGISALYYQKTKQRASAKYVCDLAQAGDSEALSIIEQSARMLGLGLSLLIDLLNPQRIIIGSIFSRSESLFRPLMTEVLESECLPGTLGVCNVVPSLLGEQLGDMAALGIARMNSST